MYYSSDQVKEDEMGEACSMHGKNYNCIHDFKRYTWTEEITSETKACMGW